MLDISPFLRHNNSRSGAALTAFRTSNQTIMEGSIMADTRICAAAPCGNRPIARGLCDTHYRRLKRRGSLETTKTPSGTAAKWMVEVALPYRGEECLIWPLAVDKDGYARGRHPGIRTDRAHRVICILAHGQPPSDAHDAAHSCGRGHMGCVAPGHLSWKLPVDNAADKLIHGTQARGEQSPLHKLTSGEVIEIRALAGSISATKMAPMFGVSQSNISMILRGETWKEVKL